MKEDVFRTRLNAVNQKINSIKTENALVLPLFSDLHSSGVSEPVLPLFLSALQMLCTEVSADAVIDLGDNLGMLGRNYHLTNTQLVDTLTALFDSLHAAADCPLFLINGNHDGIGTDFFDPSLWSRMVNGKYDDGLAHYNNRSSYYYVDYDRAHVRLVFLSVPYGSDLHAEQPTPLWAFGQAQLAWLREDALCTENDVLLFTHVPFYYRYRGNPSATLAVWDGERTVQARIAALCGWIDDATEAASILNESGKVIACFSGHTHRDEFWAPRETRGEDVNPLVCPQVVTRKPIVPSDTTPDVLFDVLVWNPAEKQIHVIRFGEGEDRIIF